MVKDGHEGYRPNKSFREIWIKLFQKNICIKHVVFTESDIQAYLDNFLLDKKHELSTVFYYLSKHISDAIFCYH